MPTGCASNIPSEMTIVLQHQFWGLEVEREHFAVTLSFGGQQERLVVPLCGADRLRRSLGQVRPAVRGPAGRPRRAGAGLPAAVPAVVSAEAPDKPGADVVTLDAFRKK